MKFWALPKVLPFLCGSGYRFRDIILKKPQKPSLGLSMEWVAERGVEDFGRCLVVLVIGHSGRHGRRLDARQPVAAFSREYATYLSNHLLQGSKS